MEMKLSLAESQKALDARGCKLWATNLLTVLRSSILAANIIYCTMYIIFLNTLLDFK